MNRLAAMAHAIGDRTNPIVVKELRQAVQNRLVIALLLLFLLVNVGIVVAFLLLSTDATTNELAGQELFSALFFVLVLTCMVFVPLYVGIRLTMERNDANMDLIFITTIAPAAIIRGKFWAAVALTGLIYSTCMPFLIFTYLLRGIDLPSIFFTLAIAFACTALVSMLAIFAGSVAGGWLLRLILAGALLWIGGWMIFLVIAICMELTTRGMAFMFNGPEAWAAFGCIVFLGLCIWGLLYLLAVASVSARSSNRMFPVRLFVSVVWLIFGVILGIWSWVEKSHDPSTAWVIVSVGLASTALILVLSEREKWSPRVRRYIPRGALGRLLAWPFFTGSAGGVIWCFGLGTLTLLAGEFFNGYVAAIYSPMGHANQMTNCLQAMFGIFLFAWCYAMTGLALRRLVAPKSAPIAGAVLSIVLLAMGCVIPMLLAYLIQGPYWRVEALPLSYLLTNPWVLERPNKDQDPVKAFLIVWALLGLAINFSWFRQQWREFRRHEIKSATPDLSVAANPVVVDA